MDRSRHGEPWSKSGWLVAALFGGLLGCLLLAGPAEAAKRIALVIGNSAYQNTSPLPNPRNDAALMGRTLTAAGFEVTSLIDADYRTMKRALIDFGRSLRGTGIEAGLFYYAGHGVQVRGENYLIPITATISSEDEIGLEGINVNDFLRVMNSSDSAINIVVLDACRNNPFARSFRAVSRGLAPVDAPKGTLIAYATAPGDVALDGEGANSPYTLALTAAIENGKGRPIESVFKTARRGVLSATGDRQVPWEVSSVTGDFYFHQAQDAADRPVPQPAVPSPDPGIAMARQFELARQIGSATAWQAFLDRYGADDANFYVVLAREALEKFRPAAPAAPLDEKNSQIAALSPPTLEAPRAGHCNPVRYGSVGGRLCASSVLSPQYGNRYGTINLADGVRSTAWVEGAKGDGIGETLVLRFDAPRNVREISLVNGYTKNADIFGKNGRVRELTVRYSNGYEKTLRLADSGNRQTLAIDAGEKLSWVSLTIASVYRGRKYRDTAISELVVE